MRIPTGDNPGIATHAAQRTLRLALAQINPVVGDVEGNAGMIRARIGEARDAGAQLVVFPELAITGYPPEDLLLKPHFLTAIEEELAALAADLEGVVALVGFAERGGAGELYDSAAVLGDGALLGTYRKMLLPNYGVFDERRYFEPGETAALIEIGGIRVGVTICEDIWFPGPPASSEAIAGASLIVNLSASPYHRGKPAERERMVQGRALETRCAYALCNTVGGQDELVFDGHSLVVDAGGETLARAAQFDEELLVADLELPAPGGGAEDGTESRPGAIEATTIAAVECPEPPGPAAEPRLAEPLEPEEAEVYAALVMGLRDYVGKNGFEHVVLGLSGGIDSALVAMIAVDALGADRVRCVVMPSPHSSDETQGDARQIAANLEAEAIELEIGPSMESYAALLNPVFDRETADPGAPGDAARNEPSPDVTAENLQARIRGNLLMALSNRFGWLVLTTGNKSELSVGYSTLYGDMAGGFAVVKDVPKQLVYALVRWRNEQAGRELVPASVLERAPSAELRPGQLDEDSLPPYEILDRILEDYVERDHSPEEIAAADGIDREVVDEVIRMVDRSEYKRRQAPPGIKISPKAFGRDRRLPITNGFGR
ncbi:MAG TPA: NAD+ synthase [Solirubrobacterales bacterium]